MALAPMKKGSRVGLQLEASMPIKRIRMDAMSLSPANRSAVTNGIHLFLCGIGGSIAMRKTCKGEEGGALKVSEY